MLALSELSSRYVEWNRRYGAPLGRRVPLARILRRCLPRRWYRRLCGPFSLQTNSWTRAFEYPWAFYVAPVWPGMNVVEIGGGLSGFQFVLSQHGAHVTNVDPGEAATGKGWLCDAERMDALNRAFGTSVCLKNCTVAEAELPPDFFDRAYCISVLEHAPDRDVADIVRSVCRCLKPGGTFVLTVDLYLDLVPFTETTSNAYGRNVDVRALCEMTPLELIVGKEDELHGFAAFDPERILRNRARYLVYSNGMAQCMVLRKPDRGACPSATGNRSREDARNNLGP